MTPGGWGLDAKKEKPELPPYVDIRPGSIPADRGVGVDILVGATMLAAAAGFVAARYLFRSRM